MGYDFEFEEGLSFGDWLHKGLKEAVHFEEEAWAMQRVRPVQDRLQAGRTLTGMLHVEIPWMEEATAFTAPGQHIYFSRKFFERCPDEEHLAFVIAHEIAHHDLGHVKLYQGWAANLLRIPGADLLALAAHALGSRLYNPEKECDADRHGLDLCVKAGYDPKHCLSLFDILEHYALDRGDLDIVYGPDQNSDDELSFTASWKTKAEIWLWQRTRGYLPIRDRKHALVKYLEQRVATST